MWIDSLTCGNKLKVIFYYILKLWQIWYSKHSALKINEAKIVYSTGFPPAEYPAYQNTGNQRICQVLTETVSSAYKKTTRGFYPFACVSVFQIGYFIYFFSHRLLEIHSVVVGNCRLEFLWFTMLPALFHSVHMYACWIFGNDVNMIMMTRILFGD